MTLERIVRILLLTELLTRGISCPVAEDLLRATLRSRLGGEFTGSPSDQVGGWLICRDGLCNFGVSHTLTNGRAVLWLQRFPGWTPSGEAS